MCHLSRVTFHMTPVTPVTPMPDWILCSVLLGTANNVIRHILRFQVDAHWWEVKGIKSYLQCVEGANIRQKQLRPSCKCPPHEGSKPVISHQSVGRSASFVCVFWVFLCVFVCLRVYVFMWFCVGVFVFVWEETHPFIPAPSTWSWSLKTCHITTSVSANKGKHYRLVWPVPGISQHMSPDQGEGTTLYIFIALRTSILGFNSTNILCPNPV